MTRKDPFHGSYEQKATLRPVPLLNTSLPPTKASSSPNTLLPLLLDSFFVNYYFILPTSSLLPTPDKTVDEH